jgi:hypothetical protein
MLHPPDRDFIQAAQLQLFALGFVSLSLLTRSSVALTGEFVRLRLSGRIASATIALWKSRWGARLARLASIETKSAADAGKLRDTIVRLDDQLAATVTALENIRLDLLRTPVGGVAALTHG